VSICVYDSLPDEAVEIRENVFVKEQGFEKEFDEIDEKAIHLVMFDEHLQKPVVTCRIYKGSKPGEFILGRLAVISECRGMNLGSDMIQKAEEVVREKGLQTAVASGSDTDVIKEYLDRTGLNEYFDMVLSSKDVKRGKPFPDVFLEICKAFDVKPEETLVLEDSANGVQAALAGNLPVINIPDLLPIPKEQQEKCVAVVENLKEVIPYI